MPFFLFGLVFGAPLGVYLYFRLIAGANDAGAREATRRNQARMGRRPF